jgi:predicted transposase YbfD/YdcC
MNNALRWLDTAVVIDKREQHKVKHLVKDVIGIVFFASLSNADEWTEIHYFATVKEEFLRKYLELPNGIPSHDTIERVFAMIPPEYLKQFQKRWNEMVSGNQGQKLRKILALDGKTQRGNKRGGQKPNHIVSCVDDDGFCLSEELVDDKSNEITALPNLIAGLNIKGHIITTDAMGCQKEIVKIVAKAGADYCLALKGNQGTLHDAVKLYFDDSALLAKCDYHVTKEKARSAIEIREYWQTDALSFMSSKEKAEWQKFKSIVMTKNTIKPLNSKKEPTIEVRYFISSLPTDAREAARAIRKHWMVESYHHHLDVTFKEDANQTAEKDAAFNLNIIRKIAINTLKILDVGMKRVSLKGKRFMTSLNPEKYIMQLLEM